MRKHTHEFVKSSFSKEGYTLLSDEYIGSKQHLQFVCPKGHTNSITFNSWGLGHRCRSCAFDKARNKYSEIKKSFEAEKYTLVSSEYVNCKTPLIYVCSSGHQHSIKWNDWRSGYRCPYCSDKTLSMESVSNSFKDHGYTLLSDKYTNSHTKLSYMCPDKHCGSITWDDWRRGRRCKQCNDIKVKPNFKNILKVFESCGYILLSSNYENSKTMLKYKCDKGHINKVLWSNFRAGNRCPVCFSNRLSIKAEAMFKLEGYTIISGEIKDQHSRIEYRCPEGHTHQTAWKNFLFGNRCPTCANIKMSGPGHPNWMGGISYEPYCPLWKDDEYKHDIKTRDGYKCLNPDCWKKDDNLHIHHIDYDKKNCGPKNLITLCRSCNARANTERAWHTAWYRALLHRRYNYEYY